jgi:fucose permease
VALSVAGLCLSHHLAEIMVCVVFLGIFNRGSLPILLSRTAEQLPRESLEVGFAVNQALLGASAALSPLLLGLVSDISGPTAAFLGTAGLCVVNAVLTIVTRKAA